jgi:hypothetical protein
MSANLRIVANNAADTATITASATAGALVPANMQVDQKAKVWRSTEPTATLTLTWAAPQAIDSIALFWTNFSSSATVRVRPYTNVTDGAPLIDITYQPDPPEPFGHFVFDEFPLARSGAAQSGSPQHEQIWLSAGVAARKLVLDISDNDVADGYLQVSRIACGMRWELATNMSYGMGVQWVDRAKPGRAESGDLRTEYLSRYRRLVMKLDWIQSTADRDRLLALAAAGLGRPMWVAGWPAQADDTPLQQIYALWGAFTAEPTLTHPRFGNWAADPTFEEFA